MASMFQRLLSFDRLIGPVLVRIVYYFGAAVIVGSVGFAVLMAVMALLAGNLGQGLMQLLAAPAVGAVAFIYWRFLCELFMLAFLAYERLGQIRDLMSGVDPNHPQF